MLKAPGSLAQTAANADFNPFPQMEQDQQQTDEQTAPKPEEQNEDAWPPVSSQTSGNSEVARE